MSRIRDIVITDNSGGEVTLTPQDNVPVEIVDSNGLNLDLTALSNVPVEVLDSNGLNLDLTTESNVPVALKDKNGLELEMFADGSVPVRNVPQSTPTIILPFVFQVGSTTLAVTAVINTYTVTVTSAVGLVIGQHFRIVDDINDKFYFGEIISILGVVITMDTQLDFAYEAGSEVTFSNKNMNVDGSVTPVIFKARTGNLSIPSFVNITRIIFTCLTDGPVNLLLFGDLPKLTRGISMRIVRPTTQTNIFNLKNNEEIVNIAFDFTVFQGINPAQGVDGFTSRLTFGGESKMGTVIKMAQDDNLEFIIQDDLTGLIRFIATFEGNIVQV